MTLTRLPWRHRIPRKVVIVLVIAGVTRGKVKVRVLHGRVTIRVRVDSPLSVHLSRVWIWSDKGQVKVRLTTSMYTSNTRCIRKIVLYQNLDKADIFGLFAMTNTL